MAPAAIRHARFRYFDLVMAAFVAVLVLSNVIGAAKLSIVRAGPMGGGGGVHLWRGNPVLSRWSYVIGDVLTEVYGYARARRVIWTGFAAWCSWR